MRQNSIPLTKLETFGERLGLSQKNVLLVAASGAPVDGVELYRRVVVEPMTSRRVDVREYSEDCVKPEVKRQTKPIAKKILIRPSHLGGVRGDRQLTELELEGGRVLFCSVCIVLFRFVVSRSVYSI